MAFRNDFPLDPPALDPDWSNPESRNQHDSLSEVRSALMEINQLIDGLDRRTITLPDGEVVEILGRSAGSESAARRWDLVTEPAVAAGSHRLSDPLVLWRDSDVTERITITGNSFTPDADQWLVAKIESLSAPAIALEVIDGSWTDYPSAYEFDGSNVFQAARLPLWRFYGVDGDGRIEVADGVFGEKLVADAPLRLVFPLVNVPSTTHFRTVPALL